jgi:predicted NBD/HSP70 family sugar kinase
MEGVRIVSVLSPQRPTVRPERGPYEGRILTLLRDYGPTSRTGLAELSGLSPTTITKIVAPLVARGLLRESVHVSPTRTRIGRPAVTLTPLPEAVMVCGVQLNDGLIRIGLADANARVRRVSRIEFDPKSKPADVLPLISDAVEAQLAQEPDRSCIGIGIGVPGTVDEEHRRVRLLVSMDWHEVAVSDYIEQRLQIPVVVEHNVRSMALAEARYGDHDADTLAYLFVRSGVGLGLAFKGHSFYGGVDRESYLGHTRVVDGGLRCTCGARGCLETVVSEPYVRRALARISKEQRAGIGVFEWLREEIADGNGLAVALQEDVVEYLATAVSSVVNLFTPGLVLVGGILSDAPAPLIAGLRERVRSRIFPLLRDDFRLESTDSGDDAMVRGVAAFALEALHYASER